MRQMCFLSTLFALNNLNTNRRTGVQKADTNALTKVTSHSDPSMEGEARSLEEEHCNATRSYLKCVPQYTPQRTKSHLPKDEHKVHSELPDFQGLFDTD